MRKRICSLLVVLVVLCSMIGFNVSAATLYYGPNLVNNPSFENGLAGWTIWETNQAKTTTETAYEGNYSFKFYKSGDRPPQLLQYINVQGGKTYEFNAFIRIPSNQEIRVELSVRDGAIPGSSFIKITSDIYQYSEAERDPYFTPNKVNGDPGDGHTVWKNIRRTVTIPEMTSPILQIYFIYETGGNWNRYFFIDNVSVREVLKDSITVQSVKFYQDGIDVTDRGYVEGLPVTVTAIVKSEAYNRRNATLVVAAYSENKLTGCVYKTQELPIGNQFVSISTTMTVPTYGDRLEVFIWDDLDNMNLLSEIYSLPAY